MPSCQVQECSKFAWLRGGLQWYRKCSAFRTSKMKETIIWRCLVRKMNRWLLTPLQQVVGHIWLLLVHLMNEWMNKWIWFIYFILFVFSTAIFQIWLCACFSKWKLVFWPPFWSSRYEGFNILLSDSRLLVAY